MDDNVNHTWQKTIHGGPHGNLFNQLKYICHVYNDPNMTINYTCHKSNDHNMTSTIYTYKCCIVNLTILWLSKYTCPKKNDYIMINTTHMSCYKWLKSNYQNTHFIWKLTKIWLIFSLNNLTTWDWITCLNMIWSIKIGIFDNMAIVVYVWKGEAIWR
jgi:hypothetical protein